MIEKKFGVLILGATYGSLFATKLLLAGHDVQLMCLPNEASLINEEGTRVRLPVKGSDELVEIRSKGLMGRLMAAVPSDIDPAGFDMVVLAMQEPQYQSQDVRALLGRIVKARLPCVSIMNMPPLTYLRRLPGLDADQLSACYVNAEVWNSFDPKLMTLASPDPQAFRPPDEPSNVLQVSLPTNFKVARFHEDRHTRMLQNMAIGIDAVSYDAGVRPVELPVKLKVHESVFVPLAKWSMLLTGNYRCIGKHQMRPIRDAVHDDLDASQTVYEWVADLSRQIGAGDSDLVPFEKYANAALGLTKPSSAARALLGGATQIERVDKLVATIGAQLDVRLAALDEIVDQVDARIAENRAKAA